MKILLITQNLYQAVGGGQTVYKKIVEATPEIDFFYFVTGAEKDAQRPPNAHPIPLLSRRNLLTMAPPPFASYKLRALEKADQYARSVAGQSFDIVDMPDFYTFGSVLRHAFHNNDVKVGRIVLAMHGNISDSIEMNWGSAGNNVLESRMMEDAQFKAVDGVYGISPRYIRAWQERHDREVCYIDPAYFVSALGSSNTEPVPQTRPSLYCIGRSERRKGNDLFIEIVRWLNRSSIENIAHVGTQDYSYQGISSAYLLSNIAKNRGIEIDYLPSMNPAQLARLYAERSAIILPVRYDPLNLVALEALFAGCPVAVSEEAGVCDYLDQQHPNLPYIKIRFKDFYAAAAQLQNLIDHYDQHRAALLKALATYPPLPSSPLAMAALYEKFLTTPVDSNLARIIHPDHSSQNHPTADSGHKNVFYLPQGRSHKELAIRLARRVLPILFYQKLRHFLLNPKDFITDQIKKSKYGADAKFWGVFADARSLPSRLKHIATYPENSLNGLREKLDCIYGNASSPLYRCNFWADIARIERLLDHELMAVTYELRILRLLGDDRLGLLPTVLETLNKHGFHHEAMAAEAMFGDHGQREERVYDYLKDSYQRNLTRQDKPWQLLEDHRDTAAPKVSVIVSLYNAADKLSFFLTALRQQTLLQQGQVEIILVDSGSPTHEHAVLTDYLKHTPLNTVYARSANRETIQAAWNRGIGLARAPYLVFLGVDETLYPEALATLAEELDANPTIDWVMANSLVTAVNDQGIYKNDIMPYTRDGATKDHTYLETCYLSWVGGMYRKSLHDRFGYYDESFGAAGDTELKNRILPYIQVKFLPKMLGLFLNYPDGQTTASPKAEIEDLRAWYIHRTLGGMRYAFENRPVAEAEAQLCLALGYRKSYCGHMSCDIEYATYLAQYIKTRAPDSTTVAAVLPGLEKMLHQLRGLELTPTPPLRLTGGRQLLGAGRSASTYQAQHRAALKSIAWPCYSVLNDNRYEQHSWLWKSS
jgi:glycosyltransferase involved in cell wall biosynthesis